MGQRKVVDEKSGPFLSKIEEFLAEAGISYRRNKESMLIWFDGWTGIQLTIVASSNDQPEFYFRVRTDSWHYDGERTDIHDCVSVILSSWCTEKLGFSSALYDEHHPAIQSLDDFEVYARYVVPSQLPPQFNDAANAEPYLDLVICVLAFTHLFWTMFGGCPCTECRELLGIKYDFRNALGKHLQQKIDSIFKTPKNKNVKDRQLPTWKYYRNFDQRISVVYSEFVARFLRQPRSQIGDVQEVESVNGKLLQRRSLKHYVPQTIMNRVSKILRKLEPGRNPKLQFLVNENRIIAIGKRYVLFADADSGLQAYKAEKELLRSRHTREFDLLFKPSSVQWAQDINDSDFEDLVGILLRREPNVLRVRKVSHTNEGDGRKDLVADIRVIPENDQRLLKDTNPYTVKKVIVQCKARQKGVGKADVADIRDTIEDYGYDGFLLVVSSHTTRDLTEHLDRLRIKNDYWIDWWTRQEIEEKLIANEDLLPRFPRVFKVA